MTIGERIFELLKIRDMSQKTFADLTGIPQSTICDWKRKKTNPAADKILIICEALQVNPYELLSGAQSRSEGGQRSVILSGDSEEYRLLNCYNTLSKKSQGKILGYVEAVAEAEEEERRSLLKEHQEV